MEGRWSRLVISAHTAGRLDIADSCNRDGLTVLRERVLLEHEERILLSTVIENKLTMGPRLKAESLEKMTGTYGHTVMPWLFAKPEAQIETITNIEDILEDPDKLQEYYKLSIAQFEANQAAELAEEEAKSNKEEGTNE